MSTFIETTDVVTTLHEILVDYGSEHIYQSDGISCFYRTPVRDEAGRVTHTSGTPGCIIGHLLDRLGRLPATLNYVNIWNPSTQVIGAPGVEGQNAHGAFETLELEFEDDVAIALELLQGDQDMGKPWGDAAHTFADRAGISYDDLIEGVPSVGRLA